MAYRHVVNTNTFQQQDIDVISADINRALNQSPRAMRVTHAEIVTWKIKETASGAVSNATCLSICVCVCLSVCLSVIITVDSPLHAA